jgi:hypothetical protein
MGRARSLQEPAPIIGWAAPDRPVLYVVASEGREPSCPLRTADPARSAAHAAVTFSDQLHLPRAASDGRQHYCDSPSDHITAGRSVPIVRIMCSGRRAWTRGRLPRCMNWRGSGCGCCWRPPTQTPGKSGGPPSRKQGSTTCSASPFSPTRSASARAPVLRACAGRRRMPGQPGALRRRQLRLRRGRTGRARHARRPRPPGRAAAPRRRPPGALLISHVRELPPLLRAA